ncbi:hypothetical protein HL653_06780 [Sphingomonas sp. AP4-R1]|uniref:hypothetical protein n=1 Tax=Sphingomonas sp. AP4-R1 TaxID=2735134 RepID=UPI0014935536|nr:hypothetical protein [Sphingomonas sp. AP4-R1]QJU57533.1 hypothetical protein HL653_06780 [Sphingomonas sp. AP4-R1]
MEDGKRSATARPVAAARMVRAGKSEAAGVTPKGRIRVLGPALPVRWTARREAIFLETLSETVNVREAARVSGLSPANVYKRRAASDAFRAAWAAALREGYVRLETMLLERALNGVRSDVWHGGKCVGSRHEFSDALALALLRQHRAGVMGAGATGVPILPPTEAETGEALAARLADMNRRLGGAG